MIKNTGSVVKRTNFKDMHPAVFGMPLFVRLLEVLFSSK